MSSKLCAIGDLSHPTVVITLIRPAILTAHGPSLTPKSKYPKTRNQYKIQDGNDQTDVLYTLCSRQSKLLPEYEYHSNFIIPLVHLKGLLLRMYPKRAMNRSIPITGFRACILLHSTINPLFLQ